MPRQRCLLRLRAREQESTARSIEAPGTRYWENTEMATLDSSQDRQPHGVEYGLRRRQRHLTACHHCFSGTGVPALLLMLVWALGANSLVADDWFDTFCQYRLSFETTSKHAGWVRIPSRRNRLPNRSISPVGFNSMHGTSRLIRLFWSKSTKRGRLLPLIRRPGSI